MQLTGNQLEEFVSITDAAHLAGVAPSTLYRWHAAGRLQLFKRRNRSFVRRADLARLMRLEPAPGSHSARG